MTKTKAQLRAEAVERLNALGKYLQASDIQWGLFGTGKDNMPLDKLRDELVSLLTDDEPQDVTTPEFDIPLYGWHESDTREKLEADIRKYRNEHCETSGRVAEWLDRQAAITQDEIIHDYNIAARECGRILRDEIAELQAERDELQRQLDTMRDVAREFRDERDGWKTKFETREFAYKQADAERKRYSEQIDALVDENEKLKEELRLVNTYSGVKGCECETTVFGMKLDEVRSLQNENIKLAAKIIELQTKIDKLQIKLRETKIKEKTCKMKKTFTTPSQIDFMQEYMCDNCGAYSYLQILTGNDEIQFCSNCGARVIGQ